MWVLLGLLLVTQSFAAELIGHLEPMSENDEMCMLSVQVQQSKAIITNETVAVMPPASAYDPIIDLIGNTTSHMTTTTTTSNYYYENVALQLVNMFLVYIASWKIGAQFPHVFLPMIIGYVICGIVAGPYVTNMLYPSTISTTDDFSIGTIITDTTLAYIAFCAGSELHFPTVGWTKLKAMILTVAFIVLCVFGLEIWIIYFAEPLFSKSLAAEADGCRWSGASIMAGIQIAGSVIEVLAIVHESHADTKAEMTGLLLGSTMLLDMTVLVIFSILQTVVVVGCPLKGAVPSPTWISVCSIFANIGMWIVCGIVLGAILQLYLLIPSAPGGVRLDYTLLPFLFLTTAWAVYWSLSFLDDKIPSMIPTWALLNIDPLLVCMIAGSWANHLSSEENREKFHEILGNVAPFIMPAFFTVAGATLDLESIVEDVAAIPILYFARFIGLAIATISAAAIMGKSSTTLKTIWMSVQSQSGVTLGLVTELQKGQTGKQPWAKNAGAVITGCVVCNQLIGPTLCRLGIRLAGEAGSPVPEVADKELLVTIQDVCEKCGVEDASKSEDPYALLQALKKAYSDQAKRFETDLQRTKASMNFWDYFSSGSQSQ